jgi:hypothetical protein
VANGHRWRGDHQKKGNEMWDKRSEDDTVEWDAAKDQLPSRNNARHYVATLCDTLACFLQALNEIGFDGLLDRSPSSRRIRRGMQSKAA